MTLQIRRNKFASEDLMKRACRQPKQLKANKVKNVSKNVFGTKLGRVHMTKQDMGKLQTRKMKGLKKATQKKDENSKKSPGEESKTSVPMDIDL
ncbi:Ribosome production factor 2-like [Homarus americanus]|uniref:Ribosome production factor 2-like n=2 Tax=Homarus americanus TaxID=6706 RepID=A0A8J5MSL5_HOMAM|nr:Ribosome production factor 2-like [Homarus americanus]